jgi:hypothetical protein
MEREVGKERRRPTHSHGQAQKDNLLRLTMRELRLTTFVSSLYYRSSMWKENPSAMWLSH